MGEALPLKPIVPRDEASWLTRRELALSYELPLTAHFQEGGFIPLSVVLSESSFPPCKSFESVTFDSGSQLGRIDPWTFCCSSINANVIPSSILVLGKASFYPCDSLESVTFGIGSRLEWIDKMAFHSTKLKSIVIPQLDCTG
jgi:hypothetical protein